MNKRLAKVREDIIKNRERKKELDEHYRVLLRLTAYRDLRQAVIYDYMKQKGYSRIKGKKGFEKKEIAE